MKRITFFVLLLTMELTLFCQNLVVNPGFDTWLSVTKPTGWVHIENCAKDSSVVFSSNYSCKHSGGASTTSDLGQTINVLPGKKYSLSFYFKTVATLSGKGARIWCYWKDAAGNSITDQSTDAVLRPSGYLKSDGWQQFSITVSAPSSAASFYLEVRTYTNSIAYWDDFVFEENLATLNSEEKLTDIKIYPNPVGDYLIISNIRNLQHINIQSLAGINVWASGFSGETIVTIPVSGFVDGLYLMSIRTSDKLITRKFVKKGY
jgi:hypothetical protein